MDNFEEGYSADFENLAVLVTDTEHPLFGRIGKVEDIIIFGGGEAAAARFCGKSGLIDIPVGRYYSKGALYYVKQDEMGRKLDENPGGGIFRGPFSLERDYSRINPSDQKYFAEEFRHLFGKPPA